MFFPFPSPALLAMTFNSLFMFSFKVSIKWKEYPIDPTCLSQVGHVLLTESEDVCSCKAKGQAEQLWPISALRHSILDPIASA